MRIDIGDVKKLREAAPVDFGYARDLRQRFTLGDALGSGGFGEVLLATENSTGKQYACKCIRKKLDVPNISVSHQAAHLEHMRREVAILKRLKGTLNVAPILGAYEDDEFVYIVLEYCQGGELWLRIGKLHYSERTAASYMRAVLRTLAQCHARRILHRDVKAKNFMLLNDSETSPLKAIDFGLATWYDPNHLPRTDLGLEGTPWFMAPEVLSSETYPKSDVWSAGVLCYQLLTGYLPFDDPKNPKNPALSKIWKAILTEDPPFRGSAWKEISEQAKDFIRLLLQKDVNARPTANEALAHPWLATGQGDRGKGTPLTRTIIQRIQRFSQSNVVHQTVFEMIAGEILAMIPHTPGLATPDSSVHKGTQMGRTDNGGTEPPSNGSGPGAGTGTGSGSAHRLLKLLRQSVHVPGGGAIEKREMLGRLSGSAHGGLEYFRARGESVHGPEYMASTDDLAAACAGSPGRHYWKILRTAAAAARTGDQASGASWQQATGQLCLPRTSLERNVQRKAARLSLDTTAHASTAYQEFVRQLAPSGFTPLRRSASLGAELHSLRPLECSMDEDAQRPARKQAPAKQYIPSSDPISVRHQEGQEEAGRGQGRYKRYAASWQASKDAEALSGGQPGAPVPDYSYEGNDDPMPRGSMELPRHLRGSMEATRPSMDGQRMSMDGQRMSMDGRPGLESVRESVREQSGSASEPEDEPSAAPAASVFQSSLYARQTAEHRPPGSTAAVDIHHSRTQNGSGVDVAASGLGTSPAQEAMQTRTSSPSSRRPSSAVSPVSALRTISEAEPQVPESLSSLPSRCSQGDTDTVPFAELRGLLRKLGFSRHEEAVTEETLARSIQALGYRLEPSEVTWLAQRVGRGDSVQRSTVAAAHIDWPALLQDHREIWLAAARKVFEGIGSTPGTGRINSEGLVELLRRKLPAEEVESAVEAAMIDAGYADEEDLDFEGFLRLLRADSHEDLQMYEARLPRSVSTGSLISPRESQGS